MGRCTTFIPARERKISEFKATSQGNKVRPCLKKQTLSLLPPINKQINLLKKQTIQT